MSVPTHAYHEHGVFFCVQCTLTAPPRLLASRALADQTVSKDLRLAITQARNAKGLTQKQLATQLNMQPQVINEYESGKAIPNNQVIAKIERALGAKLPRAPKK